MMEITTTWLIPCNVNLYDPIAAFSDLGTIDWRQTSMVNEGDTVYVYCSRPYSRIMFKTLVERVNIPETEADRSDSRYHKTEGASRIGASPRFGYMRLRLVKYKNTDKLGLHELAQYGLIAAPQGPRRLNGKLLSYIQGEFKE